MYLILERIDIMGFKVRSPRIKVGKGTYVRFGKNGTSITRRTKYVTQTTNLDSGKTRTTVRTPIKSVRYVKESTQSKPNKQVQKGTFKKSHSPTTYKICGIILLVIGIITALLSILTFLAGGWILLLFATPMIYFGYALNTNSKRVSKNETLSKQAQAENHMRIIQDCTKILSETVDPDTFFSRLDLLKEHSKQLVALEPYVTFRGASPTAAFEEVIEKEQEAINQFIVRYYNAVFEKAATLKTERAKNRNFQFFYDSLCPYYDRMDERNKNYIEYKHKVSMNQ